jgi:GNAT superfamily N-acetyltransferase
MENTVVGYYSLYPGSVSHETAPPRLSQGLGRYPVGVIVLTRLARHIDLKGKGVGPALLKNAFLRTLQAAEIIGGRALLAHAKGDRARQFYEDFDFVPFPDDPYTMYLLIKDLKAEAKRQR